MHLSWLIAVCVLVVTDRPGDYYRALPITFARKGFLVVVPDFRGHNDSQGLEYAHGLLESNWYSRDSIAAFRALDSLRPSLSGAQNPL